MYDINLEIKNIQPELKEAFQTKARSYMTRTFNPCNILRAYEDKDKTFHAEAEWNMIVAVTKARMAGLFEEDVIHKAEFEIR